VIGLEAQGQVAEVEQAQQKHGSSRERYPVWAQAAQHRGLFRRGHFHSGFQYRLRIPGSLGFGECSAMGRVGRKPVLKTGLLSGVGAFQFDQPVQCLIHGVVIRHIGCLTRAR
jgi:hypothetical protein